jgi:hypothetical protein
MRKLTIKGAKTKAWSAISRYIRQRDPYCITCKIRKSTQCAHYKHNSDKPNNQLGGNELWYDERNYGGSCTLCNCYNSGELDLFALYLEKKYGAGILQELQKKYNTPHKWSIQEILTVAELYERKCASM